MHLIIILSLFIIIIYLLYNSSYWQIVPSPYRSKHFLYRYLCLQTYYTGFCFTDKLPSYSEVCETPDSTQSALTQTQCQPNTNQTEQAATDSLEIDGRTAEGQVDKNDTTQEDQQDQIPKSSGGNNPAALTLAEFIVPEDTNVMLSPSA